MAPGILSTRPTLHEQYLSHPSKKPETRSTPAADILLRQQADIDWVPSFEKYQARASRRVKEGNLPTEVPQGFPLSVEYAMRWTPEELRPSQYIYNLSDEDVTEIDRALEHFKGLGFTKDDISRETFPLPQLQLTLDRVAQGVHGGRGIALLRGLDPRKYSFADNIILYTGVASYIGEKRGIQGHAGHILVHIKDVGDTVAPKSMRQAPYTNKAQPFHTDLGDVIAMYAIDVAATGGRSNVASAAQVYNDIATTRPDLIHVLADKNWAFDKHEEDGSFYEHPILCHDAEAERVSFCFSRRQLTGSGLAPRPKTLPPLTDAQAEALDAVHFTANKHVLSIELQRGDMTFVNNLGIFHAREAFTDDVDKSRHLVRMWIRNEKLAWKTPDNMDEIWDEIYGGKIEPVWYMDPNHTRAHVISRKDTCHA
ncbi:taurine catabolism dioxygenase TauD, TfdA family protein [Lophium mytilinum]|uniref:Taurine catabolism dioxygenase TauD, TfdA family protein n=1 Tax=Lophium mytilinum TaxID=390894 RepID=A0A6A6QCS7_9PEZI|nr:taurine catabolism dioxygenase TauD, TfdA family protein [Lophium mytilinum]